MSGTANQKARLSEVRARLHVKCTSLTRCLLLRSGFSHHPHAETANEKSPADDSVRSGEKKTDAQGSVQRVHVGAADYVTEETAEVDAVIVCGYSGEGMLDTMRGVASSATHTAQPRRFDYVSILEPVSGKSVLAHHRLVSGGSLDASCVFLAVAQRDNVVGVLPAQAVRCATGQSSTAVLQDAEGLGDSRLAALLLEQGGGQQDRGLCWGSAGSVSDLDSAWLTAMSGRPLSGWVLAGEGNGGLCMRNTVVTVPLHVYEMAVVVEQAISLFDLSG